MGLVGFYGLGVGGWGNRPAGHHPGGQPDGSGQQDEGAAEIAASALPAFKEKPFHRVAARWRVVLRGIGEGVDVIAAQVFFDGLGLTVGVVDAKGNLFGQQADAGGDVLRELGEQWAGGNCRALQLGLGEPGYHGGPGKSRGGLIGPERRGHQLVKTWGLHRVQVPGGGDNAGRNIPRVHQRDGNIVVVLVLGLDFVVADKGGKLPF